MKKLVGLFILFFSGTSLINAQPTDFRNFSWGDSFEKVVNNEKAKLVTKVGDDEIVYRDMLGGSDCEVTYIFNDNNKLVSGMYKINRKYSNPQLYIEDYETYRSLLSQKYGNPSSDKENWRINAMTLSDRHNYGQAIVKGDLALSGIWLTPRSSINLLLQSTEKDDATMYIIYTARSLDELKDANVLKAAMKKL